MKDNSPNFRFGLTELIAHRQEFLLAKDKNCTPDEIRIIEAGSEFELQGFLHSHGIPSVAVLNKEGHLVAKVGNVLQFISKCARRWRN